MRVTITGGTGNVAEYVIKELEDKFDLTLFDRIPPGQNRFNFEVKHPVVVGDLLSVEDCEQAVKGSDAIIHLAAIPYPTEHPRMIELAKQQGRTPPPYDETMKINTMGTYYVMEAARRQGVKVVVASTSNCVLGHIFRLSEMPFPIEYLPVDEKHPTDPEDTYSVSKQFQEQILHSFARAYGLRCYNIRPAGVRRPERHVEYATNYQHPPSWDMAFNGYADIRDLARAFRLCLEAGLAGDLPPFDDYFVNNPDTLSLEDTKDMVARLRPDLVHLADGFVGRQAMISAAKAERAFGWRAEHSWTEYLPK